MFHLTYDTTKFYFFLGDLSASIAKKNYHGGMENTEIYKEIYCVVRCWSVARCFTLITIQKSRVKHPAAQFPLFLPTPNNLLPTKNCGAGGI